MEEKIDALSITDDEDDSEEDEIRCFEKKGVLSKWTNYLHGWQDRYIVLKEGTLSYFKSENDLAFGCRGAVSLSKASVTVCTCYKYCICCILETIKASYRPKFPLFVLFTLFRQTLVLICLQYKSFESTGKRRNCL